MKHTIASIGAFVLTCLIASGEGYNQCYGPFDAASVGGVAASTIIAGAEAGSDAVPDTRTVTVNGVTGTLASNLTFTVDTGFTGSQVTNAINSTVPYAVSMNQGVATTNSPTFKQLTLQQDSIALSREEVFRAGVSDVTNDFFVIGNGSTANNIFVPSMIGQRSASTQPSLNAVGQTVTANDSGTIGLVRVVGRLVTGDVLTGTYGNITNRPIFEVLNNTTSLLKVDADGEAFLGGYTVETSDPWTASTALTSATTVTVSRAIGKTHYYLTSTNATTLSFNTDFPTNGNSLVMVSWNPNGQTFGVVTSVVDNTEWTAVVADMVTNDFNHLIFTKMFSETTWGVQLR